jgi:hypothetical protein
MSEIFFKMSNIIELQQDISRQYQASKVIRIENFTNQRREFDEYT